MIETIAVMSFILALKANIHSNGKHDFHELAHVISLYQIIIIDDTLDYLR